MKRTLRRGIPVAAVAAAAIATGVLLATRPWDSATGVQEAAATPAEFGLCNVSVSNIPPGVNVSPFLFPALEGAGGAWEHAGPSGDLFFLRIVVPLPGGQRLTPYPDMGKNGPEQSSALVNALTGEIAVEGYVTPADEAKIKSVLATLKVGPWRPTTPAWPRTDTPPKSELVDIPAPLRTASDLGKVDLLYRQAEAGSGMVVGRTSLAGGGDIVRAYTCDSIVEVDGHTGAILRKDVVPQEEAMFQRFLEEVEVVPTGASAAAERGPR